MPLCFGTLGSVRTSSSHQFARWPSVFQVFWPFTIQWSPSRTADVRSDARSEPAFGSEKPWHQMSSPRSMRGRSVRLLLVGAVLDDRGRDVREAERVECARRVRAVHLLGEDDLLHDAGAAAAPLLGPGDRREARVGERAVPRAQVLEPLAADLHRAAAEAVADELGRRGWRRARRGTPCGTPRPRAGSGSPCQRSFLDVARSTSRCRRGRAARRSRVAWRRSRRAAPRWCGRGRRP